jgi:hypothetical protein
MARNSERKVMSKRTRHADNSKRQQPVQQQRAQAAQQTLNQRKVRTGEEPQTRDASAERTPRR